MDTERFDRLVRAWADPRTRRSFGRVALGALLGTVPLGGGSASAGKGKPKKCKQGEKRCGDDCVDLQKDERNCGKCGNGCGGGDKACCSGECLNISSDPANCGRCGRTCDEDQQCANGRCISCRRPKKLCSDGQCVDTLTDPKNCGGCGRECPKNETCENGICRCPGPDCRVPGGGKRCCPRAGGICCPNGKCCPSGSICSGNDCCPPGQYSCRNGFCCPNGLVCSGSDCLEP